MFAPVIVYCAPAISGFTFTVIFSPVAQSIALVTLIVASVIAVNGFIITVSVSEHPELSNTVTSTLPPASLLTEKLKLLPSCVISSEVSPGVLLSYTNMALV